MAAVNTPPCFTRKRSVLFNTLRRWLRLRSVQVEAIVVHHFGPRGNKVGYELLL